MTDKPFNQKEIATRLFVAMTEALSEDFDVELHRYKDRFVVRTVRNVPERFWIGSLDIVDPNPRGRINVEFHVKGVRSHKVGSSAWNDRMIEKTVSEMIIKFRLHRNQDKFVRLLAKPLDKQAKSV